MFERKYSRWEEKKQEKQTEGVINISSFIQMSYNELSENNIEENTNREALICRVFCERTNKRSEKFLWEVVVYKSKAQIFWMNKVSRSRTEWMNIVKVVCWKFWLQRNQSVFLWAEHVLDLWDIINFFHHICVCIMPARIIS